MYAMMQWSVDRGLLKYINQREQQDFHNLASMLSHAYKKTGNWKFIAGDNMLFYTIADRAGVDLRPGGPGGPGRGRRPGSPEYDPRDTLHAPPPIRRGDRGDHPARNREPVLDERLFSGFPDQSKRRKKHRAGGGFGLLDAEKTLLAGDFRARSQSQYIAIRVDGAESGLKRNDNIRSSNIVGWIAFNSRDRIIEHFDLDIASELRSNFLIISILVIFLSGLVSFPLSIFLVRRVKSLAQATHHIASGHFETRLKVTSRDEIGVLFRDFNHLAQSLEKHDTERKRWIADVSHELRTPLAIMKGELEAMADGIRSASPENIRSAQDEVENLSRLVDDLYDLTKSDLGALQYKKQNLDLLPILQHELNILRDHGSKKSLSIIDDIDRLRDGTGIPLWADENRLKQLFRNLFQNAVQYTDYPGTIQVFVSIIRGRSGVDSEKNWVEIILEDSKPGVPEDHLERIFDPLFRVDAARNRRTGGSGLGLAICRRIVDGHNGRLSAAQSSLGGVRFTVRLPCV
ncbi:signal transduction histidine kinase [Oleiphilus messinensis]|uniref:histidine kinase n=2 Tax=Oleiphilus messinensis TaxID=141451 RepID=A0A1Y0I8Z1_9GAMM|nr:signal transduction histidine kinase [Oleiphilus messinensis]